MTEPPLTPQGKRAVKKMAADAQKMLLQFATNLATHVTNRLEPELAELAEKAERVFQRCDTEKQRLGVAEDFIEDIEKLLKSVDIEVTVEGRSFKVKGFIE